ncbi:MAG: hypothetical protein H7X78_03990 [Methyloceanibacter sp.]|nr:hypothetical protein [Methyloceanibacter sp.]
MELSDYHPWRMANHWALLFVVICGIAANIERQAVWFGFLPDRWMQTILSVGAGAAIFMLTKRYVRAIASYTPTTSLEAKRANEQIKLTANFSNTIAAAWIAVVALAQLIKPEGPNYYIITLAVVIAGFIHGGARNMVGLIKDEAVAGETGTVT